MGQLRVIVLDSSPTSRKVLEVILRREGTRAPVSTMRRRRYASWPMPGLPTCSSSA